MSAMGQKYFMGFKRVAQYRCTAVCMCVCIYVRSSHIAEYDQPGKVVNPARGQLNREN